MSLDKLFTRYGSPSTEADVRLSCYLLRPDKLTADEIAYYDGVAQQTINAAQDLIDNLKEYRQALTDRYNQLATAAYTYQLKIERTPATTWHGVRYEILLAKIYADGTEVRELYEKFEGKQRREALARFEELKKQRPGIETVKDIERRSWER